METEINYLIDVITEPEGFVPNSEEVVIFDQVNPMVTLGCTDPLSCTYNISANLEDGSCRYPESDYLDCSGICINDFDLDGVCDESEIVGVWMRWQSIRILCNRSRIL